MSNDKIILYRINDKDEIVFVNEEWNQFAGLCNAANPAPDKVIFRSLWSFITDELTRFLYREILKKVRTGHNMEFNIRCDSADYRRLLKLKITLQANGEVQFENHVLKIESHSSQIIFENNISRSKNMLIICSWCNRINVGKEIWQEVEKALINLNLFEVEQYPRLSHGICPDCYLVISDKFNETT